MIQKLLNLWKYRKFPKGSAIFDGIAYDSWKESGKRGCEGMITLYNAGTKVHKHVYDWQRKDIYFKQ